MIPSGENAPLSSGTSVESSESWPATVSYNGTGDQMTMEGVLHMQIRRLIKHTTGALSPRAFLRGPLKTLPGLQLPGPPWNQDLPSVCFSALQW